MEEIEFILDSTKEQMQGAIKHLEIAFSKIRAGKASPQMLDNISIDYYGALTPLSQASNINTPDARTISVQPWDKSMLEVMEKAIIDANLGFNPMNNGESIIIEPGSAFGTGDHPTTHLCLDWLSKNQPGGHEKWSYLSSDDLDKSYANKLASIDKTDTLIAVASKK